jgi:hypothetical protein
MQGLSVLEEIAISCTETGLAGREKVRESCTTSSVIQLQRVLLCHVQISPLSSPIKNVRMFL